MGNIRYLIDDKNFSDFNFELLYITKSKFENDWHSTAHIHPFMEIFFITEGNGSFQLEDSTVNVKEYDLIIINPNCLHTEKSNLNTSPLEYIVLGIDNFSINFFNLNNEKFSQSDSKNYHVINLKKNSSIILNQLNLIIDEIKLKNYKYEVACKSMLSLFILNILRTIPSMSILQNEKKNLNLECAKIKNYLDSHYSENITLETLSNLSYMNKFSLVHAFTKQIGMSPISYLIEKRITEAKSLLETTNYSIKDIGSIVGFSNSSYFSQMFKKQTNLSPKQYKVNMIKKPK